MPYLNVSTNAEISPEATQLFLNEASRAVAVGTGKPEQYVMVKLETAQPMLFAGSNEPAAFVELKSIGYPADGMAGLANALCSVVMHRLGVSGARTFIVFEDVKATAWAVNGELVG